MKLGDMTIKQLKEFCCTNNCKTCPFYVPDTNACILHTFPSNYIIDMEVNINAED